ncbi:META domain-containing protein [Altererythrobacter aerius]|uniref:META domain-containing protein n=1 Tax=Tsuneonella aeria TaxID=1837929 RepID=A0A6I4TEK1_9SPHN|nr:META domain-containing protein [Tsuneonella aeria]MXO75999.1 META domain-containing protein [Tsuneonella aeria]
MRAWVSLLAVILCACNPAPDRTAGANLSEDIDRHIRSLEDLKGSWRVVSIDGEALPEMAEEPFIAISSDAIGGSIGCNAFGGLALLSEGRIAAHSWGGDAMGCPGRLNEQEQAISELFLANPQVLLENDQLEIRSSAHRLTLRRTRRASDSGLSPDPMRIPVAGPVSQKLADTRWTISRIDGQTASSSPSDRHLRFSQDGWQGLASCATLFGTYAIQGDRLLVEDEIGATEQNCTGEYLALDDAFADLMRSDPRYLVGPNGELLIAGGGHVLIGNAER